MAVFYDLSDIWPFFNVILLCNFLRIGISMMVRVFARAWRPGFNPRSSHTKDSKIVLDATLLNTQYYKEMIKGKWSNPGKGLTPSPTHWCRSYRKGSLRVTIDYGRRLYFTFINNSWALQVQQWSMSCWVISQFHYLKFWFRKKKNDKNKSQVIFGKLEWCFFFD